MTQSPLLFAARLLELDENKVELYQFPKQSFLERRLFASEITGAVMMAGKRPIWRAGF